MGTGQDKNNVRLSSSTPVDRKAARGCRASTSANYLLVPSQLCYLSALRARVDAVEAIISADGSNARERLLRLRELLKEIGKIDLAKGLSRIQYLKVSVTRKTQHGHGDRSIFQCTPRELARLVRTFAKVADTFQPFEVPEDVGFSNAILNDIVFSLPSIRDSVKKISGSLNLKKADEDKRVC